MIQHLKCGYCNKDVIFDDEKDEFGNRTHPHPDATSYWQAEPFEVYCDGECSLKKYEEK